MIYCDQVDDLSNVYTSTAIKSYFQSHFICTQNICFFVIETISVNSYVHGDCRRKNWKTILIPNTQKAIPATSCYSHSIICHSQTTYTIVMTG